MKLADLYVLMQIFAVLLDREGILTNNFLEFLVLHNTADQATKSLKNKIHLIK